MGTLNIADDGASINWVDTLLGRQWTARAPSVPEWQRLWHGNQTDESLAKGRFLWVNGFNDREVIVVFAPFKGLDFNLTFSVLSGELLKIEEAR
ncbi:hypothetical protein R69658_07424 [Paraburkholderia aspalathi]|uniref:Uncharacterized protein n=1 Tax=Paraburkholderia aspalathi TaxID=1324617 RepID=A0ABN7N8P8_9BURK|nr:hypothetical protein [Paraburkholderia aspalathi]MBK3823723.1 hypothetical protein [Paraburkholderia aspalathi]MBK3835572.1 hypothetical protein [Paraburkholderia aspalathi]MBK3844584.1 hypothetical protein [Paraburkholderia aspalathi]MBK3865331.1 hypothetical protein [Paraburkholderia aspalathi]CAE6856725.1 hypothetical protein R69658_07424 [Paraburkholderia aspalathi]